MRKTVTAAIAAFVFGSVATGVLIARAQPAGPPGMPPAGFPSDNAGPMARGPWMGPGQGPRGAGMPEHHAHRFEMIRAFALVHPAEDRKLTPADVKKIAEAFLLWNGNHTWQVRNVAQAGDAIGFELATPEGSMIARFTMDPKTGRLSRVG